MSDLVQEVQKENEINQSGPITLDVHPIGKGKRILLYLADMFINFFMAILLFSVLVYPLSKVATNDAEVTNSIRLKYCERMDLLYDNSLLDSDENEKYSFDYNIKTSGKEYVRKLCFNLESDNYFTHFYLDIIGHDVNYLTTLYQKFDTKEYFTYAQNEYPKLNETLKAEFLPLFDEKDEISAQGQLDYNNFIELFFLNVYYDMIGIIENSSELPTNSPLLKYSELKKEVEVLEKSQETGVVVSIAISYLLASIICFVVVPLLNHRGKSISMFAMKLDRLGANNMKILSKVERGISSIYMILASLVPVIFVPMMYFTLEYLFKLPWISYVSIISLIYVLISLAVLLFNSYNQTLSDVLTKSVYVQSSDLEEIYKVKGMK